MPGEDYQSWSPIATSNSNSDSSINWQEGQPRASVNNSSRSMMAAHAKDRNLKNGSIVTGGTTNAQTFFSGLNYTTIPVGLRAMLKIGADLTSVIDIPLTLEMDGLGPVNVKDQHGEDVEDGLIAGTYAHFLYNGTNWIWIESEIINIATSLVEEATTTIINNITSVMITQTTIDTSSGPVALIDFTDLDTTEFQYFEIVVAGFMPETLGAFLSLNVSTDNGVTFITTSTQYNGIELFQSQGYVIGGYSDALAYQQNDRTFLAVSWAVQDQTAKFPQNIKIALFGFEPDIAPVIHWDNSYYQNTTAFATISTGRGYVRNTTAANAVRLWPSSGNIAKAKVSLVGYRLGPPPEEPPP